jgi:eukaryotic-like serine/threonine-protein kinase
MDFGSLPVSLDRACDHFEAVWPEKRPRIEDYLRDAPEPGRAALLRALLELELELRRGVGERPDREEYRERFLEHAELVDAVFDADAAASTAGSTALHRAQPRPEADSGATSARAAGAPVADGPRFRILEHLPKGGLLAEGGLGEIYVAIDGELGRVVALKQIREQCANDPDRRARFVQEARITGTLLEHPGVVPIYGLGRYADGRPYYAMRLIRGESLKGAIEEFHKANKTPGRDPGERRAAFRQLLRRFLSVCNTIAYAHSHGVLHCDLKPANVMLSLYDETLVIDWGLAKIFHHPGTADDPWEEALQPASNDDPAFTQAGGTAGTPAYMSPEQAGRRPECLGLASDVYGLGATLYCLLTGEAPFSDPLDVAGGTEAVLQKVRKGEFSPPQGVPPALEKICLKAMALGPEDRYSSARALADDVERWLADEPVSAYREPWTIPLTRWLRRNQSWARAGIVGVVSLIGLLVVLLIFMARERQARREAQNLLNLVGLSTLSAARGEKAERREAYEQAKAIFEHLRRIQPEDLQYQSELARCLGYIGDLYLESSRLDLAEQFYRQSHGIRVALWKGRPGDGERELQQLARSHRNLGRLYRALGRSKDAIDSYRKAEDIEQSLVARHPGQAEYRYDLARTCENIGVLLREDGRPQEALDPLRECLQHSKKLAEDHTRGDYRDDLASCYVALGMAQREAGQPDDAHTSCQEAKKNFDSIKGKAVTAEIQHDRAQNLDNLGRLQRDKSRPDEARKSFEEALSIQEELVLGDPTNIEYRNGLGVILNDLGRARAADDRRRAVKMYQRAIAIQCKALADNPRMTPYWRSLGESYHNLASVERDPEALEEDCALYYEVACHLASCFAAVRNVQDELTPACRSESSRCADWAMDALRTAMAIGLLDMKRIQEDERLDPLRSRDDFRALLVGRAAPIGPSAR